MNLFYDKLKEVASTAIYNNYGAENYDERLFGTYTAEKHSIFQKVKNAAKKVIGYDSERWQMKKLADFAEYYDRLKFIYGRLDKSSQELLVLLIAYRILGHRKVSLPVNNPEYWNQIEHVRKLQKGSENIATNWASFELQKYDLHPLGYNIELFFNDLGVVIDFILEQYACKRNGNYVVHAEHGDTVLDLGGCWGDTALYFAEKVGPTGKVFSFEFIPDNISVFEKNISLNRHLENRIKLVRQPVSAISDQEVFYEFSGPGSKICSHPFQGSEGKTATISIDDFVERNNIQSLDFVKMDIEGEELNALKGGLKSIKRFRPKLAIAIYHSMEDMVEIPRWLMELDLNYDFYLGHYTIHAGETVIYAKPRK